MRELESVIERAVITSHEIALQVLDWLEYLQKTVDPVVEEVSGLSEQEVDQILQVLRTTEWRIEGEKGAAAILDLNATTLRARIMEYGILHD